MQVVLQGVANLLLTSRYDDNSPWKLEVRAGNDIITEHWCQF